MHARIILKVAFCALLTVSCAKEMSAQERVREQSTREYERLSAAAGEYAGSLTKEGAKLPTSLEVVVQKNPSGGEDQPILQGTLRVGLFGGTRVVSRQATYDFGTKELKIIFPTADPSAKIELRGVIADKKRIELTISTPHSGVWKGELDKDTSESFNSVDLKWNVTLQKNDGSSTLGTLHMKRIFEQIPAPSDADLPDMAKLDASLEMPYLAKIPIEATSVLYYPFSQLLQFRFAGDTRIIFQNIASLDFAGVMVTPSSQTYNVKGSLIENPVSMPLLPPDRYQGVFTATPSSPRYVTIGYLDSQGTTSSNPLGFAFGPFPSLRMVVLICDFTVESEIHRGEVLKKAVLDLLSIDHIDRKLVFSTSAAGSQNLELAFKPDWSVLEGDFVSTSGLSRPHVRLKSDPSLGYQGCGG